MTETTIKELSIKGRDAYDAKIRKLEWLIEHGLGHRYTTASLMRLKRERALLQ